MTKHQSQLKPPRIHELKAWPYYFDQVWRGIKPFEFRRDDRGFAAGDGVRLREWSHDGGYTGREIGAIITCVVGAEGDPRLSVGIPPGYVILGLHVVEGDVSLPIEPLRALAGGAP
jgi:hypothetical protein